MGKFVNWLEVLPLLGVVPTSNLLPTVMDCPLCKSSRLYLFQDTTFGGEWHYCYSCRSGGDLITLASRTWKTDLPLTLARLRELGGFPRLWSREEEEEHGRFMTNLLSVQEFWERIRRDQTLDNSDTHQFRVRLNLRPANNWQRWKERMGDLVAVVRRSDLSEGVIKNSLFESVCNHSMLMPFWDLPGRIAGFYALSRRDQPRYHGYRLISRVGSCLNSASSGIGMLPLLLLEKHPELGDFIFVTDAETAIYLHEKNFNSTPAPLPLLCVDDKNDLRPDFSHGLLFGRKVIFLTTEDSPEVLRMAKEVDGSVFLDLHNLPVKIRAERGYLTPDKYLRAAIDVAVPWQQALENKLSTLMDLEAESFLRSLEFNNAEENDRFAESCSLPTRERLKLIGDRPRSASISLGHHTIIEARGHWYAKIDNRPPRLISDAILRIDKLITGAEIYYQGRILFKGEEIPFSCSAGELEENPLVWMRTFLLKNNHGVMSFSKFVDDIISVAVQFHQPETVKGVQRRGWNEDHASFVFDGFAISAKGEVVEVPAVSLADCSAPAKHLTCQPILPDEVEALSRNDHVSALVWSLMTVVSSNLLASAKNSRRSGTILLGRGAEIGGPMAAKFLGCAEHNQGRGWLDEMRNKPQELQQEHDWPILLRSANPELSSRFRWLLDDV